MAQIQEQLLGLLGYPLGHSFSAGYFQQKFRSLGLIHWQYRHLERENTEAFREEIQNDPRWRGFNVTIPHKQEIIRLLDSMDPLAERIGAVNVVKILPDGSWRGYNSDYEGFRISLLKWQNQKFWKGKNALILGNGGASRAVQTLLRDWETEITVVTRSPESAQISWQELSPEIFSSVDLIVQCTPLGMSPRSEIMPPVPANAFAPGQMVMDLIYNPEQTLFLQKAAAVGALTCNGMPMLISQAEKAWEIWHSP